MNLPLSIRLSYASGMAGWSILVNIIGVMLPYYYLPPKTAGWDPLVSQFAIWGVFNVLAIITTSGRLVDAFYDPFIGQLSDRSMNPKGRRLPFMRWSFVPAAFFCFLIFYPPSNVPSSSNTWWLFILLGLFFISATTYIIPCNALLPEMSRTAEDRVHLSVLQQVGFVLGIVISSSTNNLADVMRSVFGLEEKLVAVQYAVGALSIIAAVFMVMPVIFINERKYCDGHAAHLPLWKSIRSTFSIQQFRIYAFADFSWYMALYIITSGLLYYVTVLAGQREEMGVKLMGTMVASSLVFYPLMNRMSKRFGKKKLVITAFFVLAIVSTCVFWIGKFPVSNVTQLYLFVILAAFPLAALGILPPAILADIAVDDAQRTGENREGIFFAVKFFIVKLGQTLGIAVFVMLTLLGKDPGHDLGLRLSGVVVAALCLLAAFIFSFFRERS